MTLIGKNILVTGGAGFVGSHVVDVLRARGVTDIIVPRSEDFNLRSQADTERLFEIAPDVVIHVAARMGGIGANRAQPGLFFYENLIMGANVIEQARIAKTPKLVLIGTVCSYPKHPPIPFQEDDLWSGNPEETNGPYGQAKRMLIVQAQAYRQQYGLNAITLLPTNMYGPRDHFDLETSHVIPALIRKIDAAMKKGRGSVELWGDGSPTREFLYVEDAAEGIVRATESYDEGDPVNLGSGSEIAMSDLALMIGALMGYSGTFTYDLTRPNGQPRRVLDVRRARERFGFIAKMPLATGIAKTIAYWRSIP